MIDTGAIRNRLMHLAVSGNLVKQDIADGDASELVETLSRKINNSSRQVIVADDIPYGIPSNWSWCKLSDIGSTNIGLTYHPEDVVIDGIPVLRSNNIKNNKMTFDELIKVNCEIREKQYINENDILICARNGSKALVGKCAIYGGELGMASFGAFMAVYRTECYEYVYYYFQTKVFRRYFENENNKQINQVTQAILRDAVIPLPPIKEQKRIVEKLKEAFTLLDEIDSLQEAYNYDIEILKNKLIDASIQGKLTEQLPEDGTAEELFAEIQMEKQQLIKEKRMKKEKALADISEDEIPFEIPDNWKWVRWGELSQSIQYGYNAPAKQEGRIKMVRISDIQDGKVLWDTVPYCDIDETEIESYLLHENDILFARTGGTVGKSYIVADVPEEAVFAGYLIRTSYSSKLCARYMKYFMESKLYWRQLQNGTIATAQPNCNGHTLSKMVLPLPPYAEQVRIVEKLDSLLQLI